jgi:hypothetical protein
MCFETLTKLMLVRKNFFRPFFICPENIFDCRILPPPITFLMVRPLLLAKIGLLNLNM